MIALYACFRMTARNTALVSMSVETVFGGLLTRVTTTVGDMETRAARGSGNRDARNTVTLGYVMDRIDGVGANAELSGRRC